LGLLTVVAWLFFISYFNVKIFATELGDGHNMPMISLGDRNATLPFKAAQLPTSKNVVLEFTLLDNKTGNNIQYTMQILIHFQQVI
jgi:hypothetical protein